ncbi:MAG: glycosyltransferase [Holophaga sp.]
MILGRCLASVRDLVDELVVVDLGSADGTVAMAQACGARVGSCPRGHGFAAARAESLRLCTGDWVLALEPDETVDVRDHGAIRRALGQGPWAAARRPGRGWIGPWPRVFCSNPGIPVRARRCWSRGWRPSRTMPVSWVWPGPWGLPAPPGRPSPSRPRRRWRGRPGRRSWAKWTV